MKTRLLIKKDIPISQYIIYSHIDHSKDDHFTVTMKVNNLFSPSKTTRTILNRLLLDLNPTVVFSGSGEAPTTKNITSLKQGFNKVFKAYLPFLRQHM